MAEGTRLTHERFYAVCEALKKNKQRFLDARPMQSEACKWLAQIVGFEITPASLRSVMKASGVTWANRKGEKSGPFTTHTAIQVLIVAVHRLHKKLGEESPAELTRMYDAVKAIETTPPINGVNS